MDLETPLISIIIPTFNAGSKLNASLRSALDAQAPFDAVEVLILDGVSTDDTVAIARGWAARDARVQVWSEPDRGVYDAMNRGIARARGQMLYFLGAGDCLRPGVLQGVAATGPDARTLVYGPVWLVHGQCNYGTRFELCDLARRNIPHQGAFYGRGVFELIGNYNLAYPVFADHELNWRCFSSSKIKTRFLDLIVADYEGGGLSDTRADPRFERDFPRLVWQSGGLTPWLCLQLFKHLPPERLRLLGTLRARLSRRV